VARISPKGGEKERVTLIEELCGEGWSIKLYEYGLEKRFWQENKADIWSDEQ